MEDLIIKSITKEQRMVTDFEVSRKTAVNGDRYIAATITKTERNKEAYGLLKNENIFLYATDEYVIKKIREKTVGKSVQMECTAIHKAFADLNDNYIYETISGTKKLRDLVKFAIGDIDYFPTVYAEDMPASVEVENFGDDNSLALLRDALNKFGAEFEIFGFEIYIMKEIGVKRSHQIRYKFNVSDPQKEIDTSRLSTYIRGYGKQNKDGSYVAEAEYTSPLADIYGIRHSDPIRDERFTKKSTLLDKIKRSLNDSIDISLTLSYIDLKELGIKFTQPITVGDYFWCILDPFDIDVRIRVIEVEDYSDTRKSPVLTLGTVTKKASHIMADFSDTQKTVNRIIEGKKQLPYRALDEAVRRATEALQSAQTELEFDNGITARDKKNADKIVVFNAAGIGISKDGGRSFRTAMTGDGIVADVITAGVLRSITIEAVEMYGSYIEGAEIVSKKNDDDYIRIKGAELLSHGNHIREWLGSRQRNEVKLMFQNGQLRARNEDRDWSLYFNDYGISTFPDGDGNLGNASGVIEFHSYRYSGGAFRGMTLMSAGRLALESTTETGARIYINPNGANVHVADAKDNYYGISASNFSQSSSRTLKRDIKPLEDDALELILDLDIMEYKRKTKGESTIYDTWQAGIIVEDAPSQLLFDGDSVDLYTYQNYIARALQQHHSITDNRFNEIEKRLQKLEGVA